MSTYFVTGATGFTGRRPVAGLLRRPDCERVFALVRPRSADRHDRLTPVPGDLSSPIDAERTGSGLPHHVTSIAVTGHHRGTFTEGEQGGTAHTHPCDLTDGEAVGALLEQAPAEHDGVDALVDNAGRSIRRSAHLPVDRLRPVLGLLPHVRRRRFGHVVNISGTGVRRTTPRFSAHLASKSARDDFSRVVAGETVADGVIFTSVRMPLVRTPMTGPTEVYDAFPAVTPERDARWVVRALERRPEEVDLPSGVPTEVTAGITRLARRAAR